jgi:uncharacterized protein YukE
VAIQQGANPDELRALGKQFALRSTSIRNAQRSIDQLTARLPQVWAGGDAEDFARRWAQVHRPAFAQLAATLNEGATTLVANADAQERTSAELDGASRGGAGGGGSASGIDLSSAVLGAGAFALGGLRSFLGVQKLVKAPFTLLKHGAQYGWVLKNERAAFIRSFQQGFHRVGGPGLRLGRFGANGPLDELLSQSGKSGGLTGALTKISDATSLKNLDKLTGLEGTWASKFLAEKPWIGAGTKLEWLGKSGLGRTLGWAGVGFSAYDAYQGFAHGDAMAGMAGLGKAALGVGCFLPPPAGTVCQVASVGIALYENREAIWNGTKAVAGAVADGAEAVAGAVTDGAEKVGGAIADGAKSVAHFFGF